MSWKKDHIPPQAGRTVVITGSNSGIGLEAAHMLAGLGAHVVMACRSVDKGERARDRIRAAHPDARVDVRRLDLADLSSVESFAQDFLGDHDRLDALVNNAGVMALPESRTADGFEMQIGTNHLGHFALTARLMQGLLATPGARVVTVSSVAHWFGRIRLDDLSYERGYSRWGAYCQSKLANLLFAKELGRRAEREGAGLLSVACHPGYASTSLQAKGATITGQGFKERFFNWANNYFAQSAAMGAYPTVHAATMDGLDQGEFVGPDGLLELHGRPKKRTARPHAEDEDMARKLWEKSEELTGVSFEPLS